MTRNIILYNFYLTVAVLFSLKSILYDRGTLFSQGITVLYIAMSVLLTVAAVLQTKMPKLLKSYLAFFLVLIFYGFAIYFTGETIIVSSGEKTDGSNYLNSIILSGLPIFASFYLTRKVVYDNKYLKSWFFILVGVTILSFYHQEQVEFANRIGGYYDDVTNNAAYLFVGIIPLVCLFDRQKLIMYAGLGVCAFFLLLGIKRGAILTGGLDIAVLLYYNLRSKSKGGKVWILVLTVVFFIAVYFFVQNMMETSEYFSYRFDLTLEGYTSNRDTINQQIFRYLSSEMTFLDFLFGRGAMATIRMFTNYAHNDWLELMVNQGLLGVVPYFIFFVYFFNAFRSSKGTPSRVPLLLILITLFVPTLFSMSYSSISFPLAFYFGHVAARLKC